MDITGPGLAEAVEREIGKEEAVMVMTGAERLRREGMQKGEKGGVLKGKLESLQSLFDRGLLSKDLYESEAKPIKEQLERFYRQESGPKLKFS